LEGDSDCLSPLRSTSAALFVHSNLDFHPESMRECIVGVKYDSCPTQDEPEGEL
jgi:hypothetical protein